MWSDSHSGVSNSLVMIKPIWLRSTVYMPSYTTLLSTTSLEQSYILSDLQFTDATADALSDCTSLCAPWKCAPFGNTRGLCSVSVRCLCGMFNSKRSITQHTEMLSSKKSFHNRATVVVVVHVSLIRSYLWVLGCWAVVAMGLPNIIFKSYAPQFVWQ